MNTFLKIALTSLCLATGVARAQDPQAYDEDPPDRAARLSYLDGEVSMQPAGEQDWGDAVLNRPLTTGDKLWTERGARAEVEVGPAAVRLDGSTGFSFLNVDDNTIQMRITAGVMNVSVRALDGNDQVEIDTPNIAVSVLRPGTYRVEVSDDGDVSTVMVVEGEAEVMGPPSVIVRAHEATTFSGFDNPEPRVASLGAPDEFDRWSQERERQDQRVASSETSRYVSPDVTGYEDLDENGSWSSEPEYGYVWTPRVVAVDWAPYRYGRWAYVRPWGWTWIDDAPWGYAPFHYGRWAQVRHRWCWVPGPRHVRAVYAPALVGWVGSPGLNVSVSIGSGVGWFPLGPREVYVPYRRFSPHYVERVNVSNTVIVNRTIIRNVYENRVTNVTYRNRGAVTAVSRTTFTSAGRVGDRRARLDTRDFERGNATAVAPRIEPGRESRFGSNDTRRNVRVPPPAVVDRQVVVKRPPPAASARFARGPGQVSSAPKAAPVAADRPMRGNPDGPRNSTESSNARSLPRAERSNERMNERAVESRPHTDRPPQNQNRDPQSDLAVKPDAVSKPERRTLPDRPRDSGPSERDNRDRTQVVRERPQERAPEVQQSQPQPRPRAVSEQPREVSRERPAATERRNTSPPPESRRSAEPKSEPKSQPQSQPQSQPKQRDNDSDARRPRDGNDRR